MSSPYLPHRPGRSRFVELRGLRCHLHEWGDASQASPARPTLVMLHGWMDVGASFQFAVDALAAIEGADRHVIAPDWRGFGLSDPGGADGYWFPDYLGDLDALVDSVAGPAAAIDLLGHSMGGNVAMVYAGVRPERIRRLVNLEGFGLPATRPAQAPKRYLQWLDELKQPMELRPYDSLQAVADRLRKTNPLLSEDRAAWLAGHWSRQADDGRWHILGDPAHKRANPVLYQKDEVLACWQRIAAPLLWVEGDRTDVSKWWGDRYPRSDFDARLAQVPQVERQVLSPAGHMLHHDQPEALAAHLARFLQA
ncbi:alpha/beta fold hydrolase [Rhizobacter sp. OV335]|uniref:alpha/beta fold hydrolase n=1 Tax=Rhizobacter sp. OV335 TaxID=1500264 RepID=UPI000911E5C7|nr:alpha/beta hydrolase [Rhizobacter sp. OV335]SHM43375.1 Pimeloyl-ACP methyl ester carboxylesterase [Rhizobacter sp. OV335]